MHEFIASYVIGVADTDRCGVHELVPAIASRRDDVSESEVALACREACAALVRAEHVRLEMTPAGADRPGRDGYTPVAIDDALKVFDDEASWRFPSDAHPRYWLVATDAGRAAYISEDVVSL